MDTVAVVQVVAGVATAVAVLFTAIELGSLGRHRRISAAAELDGVGVAWELVTHPRMPDEHGYGVWGFHIVAQNPGQLPIRDVRVVVDMPCEVRRVNYDATLGEPTRFIEMRLAAMLGNTSRSWNRELRLLFADRDTLGDIRATITFTDYRGTVRTNRWPV